MAIEIVVPRLGWSMEEGVFGEWLYEQGALVQAGDLLYVLEGEKAAQDIESFDGGTLHIPGSSPQPGDVVKVGQLLGYLLAEGEDPPAQPESSQQVDIPSLPGASQFSSDTLGQPSTLVSTRDDQQPPISPRARRIAAELGIEWVDLTGSGSSGRIREQDVLAAAGQLEQMTSSEPAIAGDLMSTSRIRRTIARRLQQSIQQTVPVTLVTRVDATGIVCFRNQYQQSNQSDERPVPTYNDILAKVVAGALTECPALNSQWREQLIFVPKHVNVAFAVDTEKGLLAPVIQDVHSKSLEEIAEESASLIAQIGDGSLRESALQGATFTITNLGMFGVDAFTPIINLPQCATLGVGQIKQEPVVVDGEVVVRDQLTLSLTFDHRVVDGAPAARCLAHIRTGIEAWSAGPS